MSAMRSIDIDFEVHKLLEANRNSFSELPNDVLRRLLGIGETPLKVVQPEGKPYVYEGVQLPHGTEAIFTYNNVQYKARIEDGFWITEDGARHKSPSGAASALAVTKSGSKTKLDGWSYWYVRKPGSEDWVFLNDLWHAKTASKKWQD